MLNCLIITIILLSLGAGLIYGSLFCLTYYKKYILVLRFLIIAISISLLHLELSEFIIMIITFIIGMWIAIAYNLSTSKKDGNKDI